MIKNNCVWCGKQVVNGDFCNEACQKLHEDMMSKPFRTFFSYSQASDYLGKDTRVIRKYEGTLFGIDKSLPNLQSKLYPCKICGQLFKTHQVRTGYCPQCSKAGEGRKAQAKEIAELYTGQKNPNYVDGNAKQTFRHKHIGKKWARSVIARDCLCRCCGLTTTLQAHHILPVALFPDRSLDIDNGVTLCGHHHIELHRAKLDLTLLPIVYEALTLNYPLYEIICLQPEFEALNNTSPRPFDRLELLRVVPKNYAREIIRIHPNFATNILGLAR